MVVLLTTTFIVIVIHVVGIVAGAVAVISKKLDSCFYKTLCYINSAGCKSVGGSRCQHHCISAQPTSRCSCAIGFTLNDDQRSCDTGQQNINELSVNVGKYEFVKCFGDAVVMIAIKFLYTKL